MSREPRLGDAQRHTQLGAVEVARAPLVLVQHAARSHDTVARRTQARMSRGRLKSIKIRIEKHDEEG